MGRPDDKASASDELWSGATIDAASAPGDRHVPAGPELPTVDGDRYVPEREVARGGMGRIIAAHDRHLARPVALKELLAVGPDQAARFRREALITARLQHPAIVPVYEAGRWPSGEPFFAMKLVAGRALDKVLADRKTLDERLALLPAVIAATDAIAYAHSQRVVHRDLKPSNVLVGDFGETVVIDWGLAKDLDATEHDSLPPAATPEPIASGLTLAGAVM
ncbi:MAG TPA: serine/threonine-protein kinase, partial [Kofleriaceae bacterium]|nr:serine/threonine-protein kinase [Kofleriaceae bacterium]